MHLRSVHLHDTVSQKTMSPNQKSQLSPKAKLIFPTKLYKKLYLNHREEDEIMTANTNIRLTFDRTKFTDQYHQVSFFKSGKITCITLRNSVCK